MAPIPPVFGKANIAGWPSAITMRSPLVGLTIVPEAGRLLGYTFGPTNYLWINAVHTGRIYAPNAADWNDFHNFGGARFDAAPQAQWAETAWGRQWPPPPVMNAGRTMTQLDDGRIRLDSYEDRQFTHLLLSAIIGIVPHSTLVRVTQIIQNLSGSDQTWANWLIAQIAARSGVSRVYVPPAPDSIFENGYTVLMPYPEGQSPLTGDMRAGSTSIVYGGEEGKLGFDGRWIAIRPFAGDDTLIALQGTHFAAGQTYPDRGSATQMYTGQASQENSYVELERTGPLTALPGGAERADEFLLGAASCSGRVIDVSPAGMTCEPLRLEGRRVFGSFGVFHEGWFELQHRSPDGTTRWLARGSISPNTPLNLEGTDVGEIRDGEIRLVISDSENNPVGELAAVDVEN